MCDNPCLAPDNATATCAAGDCGFTCEDGLTECSGGCVDLDTDPANCGSCNNRCVSRACQNGACCTTGTCGSLTCPATADICTGTGLSCGSGSVSCYCHVVPVASGGTASVCGSRTSCFENLQDCTPGDPCNYNGTNDGICISCGGCISCFKPCSG
jgi:hypothetical protein